MKKVNLLRIESKSNAIHFDDVYGTSTSNLVFEPNEVDSISFCGSEFLNTHYIENGKINNYNKAQSLYRSLKQKSATEHNQPGVSHWHGKEKTAALELVKQRFPLLWRFHWLNLYRISSGYGEHETRAFIWLIILILIPLGLNALPYQEFNFPYSELVNRTLSYIPFTKDLHAQSGWLRLGQGVSQLFIAIQATIFAFALRNRFRR